MRMTPDVFDEILHSVTPLIEKKNTFWRRGILADARLALTLRFLATGESYRSLSFAFRIGRQTVQKIVPETCEAIWKCFKAKCLAFPQTAEEWKRIAINFHNKGQLPHCCGSIDGKHDVRECPKNSGSLHFNYKGTFSSVLLALADANYKFIMVDYGHYGSESDGGIFRKTFGRMVINNEIKFPLPELLPNSNQLFPFFIIMDEAFPLRNNLLRSYPRRSNFLLEEKIYNYRVSRARRVVENAFGILAARFRIFRRPLNYSDSNVKSMVLATCVLHNLVIEKSEAYCPVEFTDFEDENHNLHLGLWRNDSNNNVALRKLSSNMYRKEAKILRVSYKNYLCQEGAVPWQNKSVLPQKNG